METLYFEDFLDFACAIADKFDELDKEDFEDVAVIAKYDEVKEIFKELVCMGYDICSITLDMPDKYGYNDEYILGLSNDGLWIEKFKRETGYFEDESTVIYVLDNCSSKVISYCIGETVYEVTVGEDDCEDDGFEINGNPVSKAEFDRYVSQFKSDEKPVTTSTATYRVNGEKVSKEEYEKAFNELDEKYLDNVQDMLLSYLDFVDEMNQWKRLLGW